MAGVQVGVAEWHFQRGPATEFLQDAQRRFGLYLPARSSVAHRVERDPFKSRRFAFLPPYAGGQFLDRRSPSVDEDVTAHRRRPLGRVQFVNLLPAFQHCNRVRIQRDRDGLTAFALVTRDVTATALKVDAVPLQAGDIRFPLAGGEREHRHITGV